MRVEKWRDQRGADRGSGLGETDGRTSGISPALPCLAHSAGPRSVLSRPVPFRSTPIPLPFFLRSALDWSDLGVGAEREAVLGWTGDRGCLPILAAVALGIYKCGERRRWSGDMACFGSRDRAPTAAFPSRPNAPHLLFPTTSSPAHPLPRRTLLNPELRAY